MKPLCIFHSVDGVNHCDDGFGAAWAVWKTAGDTYDYHPGVYQTPPPDVTGRDVLLVDFSYKRPVMEAMAEQANTVTILDHHATAKDDLVPLLEAGVIGGRFDMGQCGSMLAWGHFQFGPPPRLLEYIQDRDLWRKEIPDGDKVIMALRSYPKTFEVWTDLMTDEGLSRLQSEGEGIYRYYRMVVDGLKKNVHLIRLKEYTVPAVNAPMMFASEVAGEIAEGHPFGVCYSDDGDGGTAYSLRSNGELHVGQFAAQFGGGGHPGAAGFTIKDGRSGTQIGGLGGGGARS